MFITAAAIKNRLVAMGELVDGTFKVIPSWVGDEPNWYIERIKEESGHEVGLYTLRTVELHHGVGDSIRFGVWADENGLVHVDQVVHVENLTLAAGMGVEHDQTHIWSWKLDRALEAKAYCEASILEAQEMLN